MELQAWFWGLLLVKFLCFLPVSCPSVNSREITQGSGTVQATNSRAQPHGTDEATRYTQGEKTVQSRTTIQAIRFNATRIRPAVSMWQAAKTIQIDWTVQPAVTTQINGGRLYRMHFKNIEKQKGLNHGDVTFVSVALTVQ